MSNGNQRAKNRLIQKFGKICMVEEAGIRKIPRAVRIKIKGYKMSDDMITFHHLIPRRKGGKATPENGALVKDYNHRWLESLSEEEREDVNNQLRDFKLNFSQLHAGKNGLEVDNSGTIDLDFGGMEEEDCIVIPAFDTTREDKKKKGKYKTRAQLKVESQKEIDDILYNDDDLEL